MVRNTTNQTFGDWEKLRRTHKLIITSPKSEIPIQHCFELLEINYRKLRNKS